MADKRKSVSKHPHHHRRNRISTTPDLLSPYLLGPELFVSPPMLTAQTVPVYLTSRSGSNLNNVSPFTSGYSSFANSIAPFDSNLIPSNSGPSYTESDVAEDFPFRSTTQSVSPQMDWCRPSSSYIAPVQSNPMISTSRNPHSDIQRFFQDFMLPDYTLDSFSGRLLDVVSSTTFTSGDVQTELHHAITRLIIPAYVFKFFFFEIILSLKFYILTNFPFCI